jgi:transporter family-2 protein
MQKENVYFAMFISPSNIGMKYILMIITFFVGAIIPVQAVLNAKLGKQTLGPLMGALLSFLTGTCCAAYIECCN